MSYIGNQPYQVAFVTDTFSGNASTTVFTMSVAPAGTSSVLVAITGVLQDPSTYSVSGTTLTFSAAPPTGTGNISCRYLGIPASGVTTTAYRTVTEFTATAGQTTFTPPSYTVGFINVYRNGALLGTADYTATNGTTVVLASAASSGDLVVVESFLVSSVLNAIPATAGSVGSTYLAGSSVTTAKIADANVTQAKLETLCLPIGVGQTWQDVTASRALDTTYTNSTGRPISILVTPNGYNGTSRSWVFFTVNGTNYGQTYTNDYYSSTNLTPGVLMVTGIVPAGATYKITSGGAASTLQQWSELR